MKKRIIAILTIIALVLSVIHFTSDTDAGTTTLNLTNQTKYIYVGSSFKVKVNGLNAKKIKWSSSKKSVATVSKSGVVTGVAKGKAVITGKYKKIKFKIEVNVTSKNKGQYNRSDIEVAFKKAEVVEEYGDTYWQITFKFTNNSEVPTCLQSNFGSEVFVNNVEIDYDSANNEYSDVKNGASVDVTYSYKVKSGDKVEFELYEYDSDGNDIIVYETSATIK